MKLEDGPKQLPDVSPLIPPINFLGPILGQASGDD